MYRISTCLFIFSAVPVWARVPQPTVEDTLRHMGPAKGREKKGKEKKRKKEKKGKGGNKEKEGKGGLLKIASPPGR